MKRAVIGSCVVLALAAGQLRADAAESSRPSAPAPLQDMPSRSGPPAPAARAARRGAPAPEGRGGRRGELPPTSGLTAAQVEQMFDRYMLAQARPALQLRPEQMAPFRQRFERLVMARRQAQRQRQRLLQDLLQSSQASGADDTTVAAKLKAVDEQTAAAEQTVREARQQLDDVLSVQQRARFLAFEQRMERQKLELIARARAEARQSRQDAPPASPPDGQ